MEFVDIVDVNGQPTGEITERSRAHREGFRHRTSHVWLTRKRGETIQLLLQKRSDNKDSFPGCYDISSAGHIPAGDGFEESALRELSEELGITASAASLIDCGVRRFRFERDFHGVHFIDDQVSRIYAMQCDLPETAFTLQKEEVSSVKWFDLDACLTMIETGAPKNCLVREEIEIVRDRIQTL